MRLGDLFEKISVRFIGVLSLLIIVPLFIASVFSTCILDKDFYTYYVADAWWINLIILLLFLIFVIFINANKKKVNWDDKKMMIFYLVFFFLIALFVLSIFYRPRTDQENCWFSAIGLVSGDYSWWKPNSYVYAYPFQNGFIAYCTIFVLIFGKNGYIVLELVNAIFLVLILIYAGKLFRLVWKKQTTSYLYSIALALYFPLTLYVTYVYGIIPGLALSIIAVYQEYQYFETNNIKHLIISALCMGFAILLKPNYSITMIAIVLILFVHCIQKKKYRLLLMIPVYFLVYFLGDMAIDKAIELRTGVETPQGFPASSWIGMGLQESNTTYGWFNRYPWEVLENVGGDMTEVASVTDEEVKQLLSDFKSMPGYAVRFFTKKLLSQWNNPTFDSLGIYQTYQKSQTKGPAFLRKILLDGYQSNQWMMKLMDTSHFLILFGCILYFIMFWKELRIEHMTFLVIFIGGVLFHTFWEAHTQYALSYFVLLIPYSIMGYQKMADQVLIEFKQHKNESKNDKKRLRFRMRSVYGVAALILVLFFIGIIVTKKIGFKELSDQEQTDYRKYCDYIITTYPK